MSRATWLVACVALTASAHAGELNGLSGLAVEPTARGAQVVVQADAAPTFTVFRLSDPDRLVVDINGASVARIEGHHQGAGPIGGVVASQFTDAKTSVARVLVALSGTPKYDVRADGSRLVISVEAAEAVAVHPAAAPAAVQKSLAEPAIASPARLAEAADAREAVVASRVDEQPVARPASKLTSVTMKGDELRLHADGQVAKFEIIELSDPPRLAVDLFGMSTSLKSVKAKGGAVKEVRVGAWPDKVRLVVDVNGSMPQYQAKRTGNGMAVQLVAGTQTAEADRDAVVEIDGQRVQNAAAAERAVSRAEVVDVSFQESRRGGAVELKLRGDTEWRVERPDAKSAVLTLQSAKIPRRLERSLDTSELETPIKMVSAFSAPGAGDRVRVVVAGQVPLEESVVKTANGLSWRLAVKGAAVEEAAVVSQAAGFSTEATQIAEQGAPQRARYVGKRVSFEFKDIDIHNLLRIIAEISKKNIVVADDVSGKITIRLRNVPWDQALELVLRSKGLGKEDLGNIIRVAPLATLEAESKLREERAKSLKRQEDLVVQLVPVNYATAGNMKDRIKEVLSERGNVTVDDRTNTLIVRDIGSNMGRIRSMVASLDTQTPQVLIESRIVEANTRLQKEVGIQWGGNASFSPSTGNATGLAFPNTIGLAGAAGDQSAGGTSATPAFAVNLPVGIGLGSGGGLGLIFGSAGGAFQLNLRLSALENQGLVKTISAPKVTTLDNTQARISQGVSIPFSQVSAAGVNTAFVEARLSLDVTPHITQDGSVLMNIRAENNQPDPANSGSNGQPAIQRKEAATQVLVKDGDTTVIGGIYVKGGSTSTSGLPVLSRIPVLGFFFRNHRELETRQELLIFITPRILNRSTVAQTP